jgi:hypothetical protein
MAVLVVVGQANTTRSRAGTGNTPRYKPIQGNNGGNGRQDLPALFPVWWRWRMEVLVATEADLLLETVAGNGICYFWHYQ